jgi:hypothetical protein
MNLGAVAGPDNSNFKSFFRQDLPAVRFVSETRLIWLEASRVSITRHANRS